MSFIFLIFTMTTVYCKTDISESSVKGKTSIIINDEAYEDGSSTTIQKKLSDTSNMYCVSHNATTAQGGGKYKIILHFNIDGLTCTYKNKKYTNRVYAKFSRILNSKDSKQKGYGYIGGSMPHRKLYWNTIRCL